MKPSNTLKLTILILISIAMFNCEKAMELYNNANGQEPKETLEKIQNLQKNLSTRKTSINSTANQLTVKLFRIKEAIENEQNKTSISTSGDALKNKVIKSNLVVMQKVSAYLDIINEEKEKIKNAEIDLNQLKNQAETDQIIKEGLQDKEMVKEIIAKVDSIIKNVEPNANQPISPQAKERMKPLDKLWEENFKKDPSNPAEKEKNIDLTPQSTETETLDAKKFNYFIPNGLSETRLTFHEAEKICENVDELDGQGWRLPSENEFAKIKKLEPKNYWTSVKCSIDGQNGYILKTPENIQKKTCGFINNPDSLFYVVCIKPTMGSATDQPINEPTNPISDANPPPPVIPPNTLTYVRIVNQDQSNMFDLSATKAETSCKNIFWDNHNDWRLPTEDEFILIKKLLPTDLYYWTSTPCSSNTGNLAISTNDCNCKYCLAKNQTYNNIYVVCVRK